MRKVKKKTWKPLKIAHYITMIKIYFKIERIEHYERIFPNSQTKSSVSCTMYIRWNGENVTQVRLFTSKKNAWIFCVNAEIEELLWNHLADVPNVQNTKKHDGSRKDPIVTNANPETLKCVPISECRCRSLIIKTHWIQFSSNISSSKQT